MEVFQDLEKSSGEIVYKLTLEWMPKPWLDAVIHDLQFYYFPIMLYIYTLYYLPTVVMNELGACYL